MLSGISFIVATIGRPSLAATLASIELWPGDELLVVGELAQLGPFIHTADVSRGVRFLHCPRGNDWGSTERNYATPRARGRYLAHIDDDDVYAPGARAALGAAMTDAPDRLTIFKMRYANGNTLWHEPIVRKGNVGTPMIFMPNDPQKLGQWGERMDCGDFYFLQTMRWSGENIVWNPTVTVLVEQAHS